MIKTQRVDVKKRKESETTMLSFIFIVRFMGFIPPIVLLKVSQQKHGAKSLSLAEVDWGFILSIKRQTKKQNATPYRFTGVFQIAPIAPRSQTDLKTYHLNPF